MIVRDNESEYGGGIYCTMIYYLSIGSSWIHNNKSSYDGAGIYLDQIHLFEIYNSIVSYNAVAAQYRYGGDTGTCAQRLAMGDMLRPRC